ncbi:triple tyrosine motif-containing protein [Clostridium tarantellae]|uniref:Triple tyrosine motif-containing protein n=1 Tax=Clostridium tarantellae TaxID=39493 RepID=A0A6I1MJ07_9CLOT|nr:triple tyrosine motif-containing protein [Clostridium tarantellae]MPQ43365.1 triple tyrosine motif-containing protein [Clostridium tarantellae]
MGEILLEIEEKEIIDRAEPINIKVINNTNEELKYKILAGKDGIWETLKEFNEKAEVNWIPGDDGNYMIIAEAKKKNSNKSFDFKVSQNVAVGVNEDRLIKRLYVDKDNLTIGEKINLYVDGDVPLIMYRYFINSKNGWQLIKDYGVDNSLTYTINEEGTFEFLVEAKTTDSPNSFDDFKTISFNAVGFKKPEITNFSCLSEERLVDRELSFEVHGNFEDERTALYKFVKINPNGKTYCIQDYSTRKMVSFIEKKAGSYKLLCMIRDMYSANDFDDRAVMVYEVLSYKPLELKGFTTDLSSPQINGANVLIKSIVEGGNNLLYRFKIDGPIAEDSGYTRNSTFVWNTKAKGDYKIILWAKDEQCDKEYEIEAIINYTVEEKRVKPVIITDVILDKDKDYLVNESIKVKVITDGGYNLRYSFVILKNGLKQEEIPYGNANWTSFTPKETGEYELEVRVKDKYSEKEYDAHTVFHLKVKEYIEGKIQHILVPSKGYFLVGDKIELEAILTNTNETLIKYVTKINEQIVEETNYINNNKITVVPKCSGKYEIELYAKNKKCKNGFDNKREVKFYINDALPVTNTKISANKAIYKLNEELNFITTSNGGAAVCYEYYIMINGSWKLVQRYSRKNYYTFRPFIPGQYRLLVLAKSHYNKKRSYEDYDSLEFIVEE